MDRFLRMPSRMRDAHSTVPLVSIIRLSSAGTLDDATVTIPGTSDVAEILTRPMPDEATSPDVIIRAIAETRAPFIRFDAGTGPFGLDVLAYQVRYLRGHAERSFQNWTGVPNASGVPDEARYRTAETLIPELAARKVPPPTSVLCRRELFERGTGQARRLSTIPTQDLVLNLASCLASPLSGPTHANIGPCDGCNASCLYCLHHSPLLERADERATGAMLRFEAWMKCLDDLHAMGTRQLTYSGIGEPLMHPRIEAALAAGSDRFHQTVVTNGVLLARYQDTVAAHVDHLIVSLDALSNRAHQSLHGSGEHTFFRIVEAIQSLGSLTTRRCQITLRFVVTRENYADLAAVPAFSRHLNVTAELVPLNVFEETAETVALSLSDLDALFEILDDIESDPDHRIGNLAAFRSTYDRDSSAIVRQLPCYAGLVTTEIRGDGSVSQCAGSDRALLGNIHEAAFTEIWRSAKYDAFRRASLFEMLKTGKSVDGCHCDACAFAPENIGIHNRLHGTAITLEELKAQLPRALRLTTA